MMNELLLRLTANMPMKQINLERPVPLSLTEAEKLFGEDGYRGNGTMTAYKPYLQRYYAGTFRDDVDLWLHRFLSNDGDRHLHSHPFNFTTIMLNGGYTEEFIKRDGSQDFRITLPDPESGLPELLEEMLKSIGSLRSYTFNEYANHGRSIDVFDWHRIAAVNDETWTAVLVNKSRLPKWFFKDERGDLTDVKSSDRNWWKDYKVRPESGIAVDDNRK